jgi:hypothetical protein
VPHIPALLLAFIAQIVADATGEANLTWGQVKNPGSTTTIGAEKPLSLTAIIAGSGFEMNVT